VRCMVPDQRLSGEGCSLRPASQQTQAWLQPASSLHRHDNSCIAQVQRVSCACCVERTQRTLKYFSVSL
jgi:hypothetical protein